MRFLIPLCRFGALAFALAPALPPARSEPAPARPAPVAPMAARTLLLDVAEAGDHLVAVGAHGVALVSEDQGVSWHQGSVPVEELLTAVAFYDALNGWAAGHGGVVLRTADGGETWTRVSVPVDAEASFLDVLVLDARHVIAAGAFELFLESRDGGHSWQARAVLGEKPDTEKVHINRLTRGPSGLLCLAAEYGTLATSADGGETWRLLPSPYEGSFYGLHELEGGRLLAHGLRSHVFVSGDGGETWARTEVEPEVLLMSAATGPGGTIALGGLGGHLFVSRDRGSSFRGFRPGGLTGTAELIFTRDGRLVCVGETGAHRIPAP
jgi:photosystem II stability/assembly factor-like uncharacterized protein